MISNLHEVSLAGSIWAGESQLGSSVTSRYRLPLSTTIESKEKKNPEKLRYLALSDEQ
jgi:hypothetical protein